MDWELASLVAAGIAAVANGAAAAALPKRGVAGEQHWRRLFASNAAFAVFYVAMFAVRRWGQVDHGDWSQAMIPFTAWAFLSVWTGPAVLAVSQMIVHRRVAKRLIEAVDR